MPTSQQTADELLAADRDRRSLERVERRLVESLDALYRDAKARAAPILADLARLQAMRAPEPLLIPASALEPGAALRLQTFGRVLRPVAALGEPFGLPPFSLADQTRNALLAAFAGEPEDVRRSMRHAIANASDASLERARNLIL